MYLFAYIFIFLILLQVVIAIYAYRSRINLKRKYSYYLTQQKELGLILEEYQSNHQDLRILATDQLTDVCFAEKDLLLISKKAIYNKDLYSILYLFFQLQLTKKKYSSLRQINILQSTSFFLQILLIIIFFVITAEFNIFVLIAAYLVFTFTITLVIWGFSGYKKILNKCVYNLINDFNLDAVEAARAEALAAEIAYEVFIYPLELPIRLSLFAGG